MENLRTGYGDCQIQVFFFFPQCWTIIQHLCYKLNLCIFNWRWVCREVEKTIIIFGDRQFRWIGKFKRVKIKMASFWFFILSTFFPHRLQLSHGQLITFKVGNDALLSSSLSFSLSLCLRNRTCSLGICNCIGRRYSKTVFNEIMA